MNTRHIDRLMSRASVSAMAAFAAGDGGSDTSKIGQPEDVGGGDAGGGEGGDLDLSPEEQAQFDAMQQARGEAPAADDGDAGDPGEGDGEPADGDGDADPAPGEREAAADGAGERKPPKTISYGRYQKELAKAQKAAEDLQAMLDGAKKETAKEREERLRLDERTKLLLEAINTKQPAAPAPAPKVEDQDPEPNKDEDPVGHLEWNNRRLERIVTDLQKGTQQREEVSAAENEERQVYTTFQADLEREAQSDPTFADAFVHLRETRFRELGFIYAHIDITDPAQCATLTPQQQTQLSQNIQKSFYNEQLMVARGAVQAGKSPAKVVKNLALARGYTPKAAGQADPAAAPPPAPAGRGNGAAPPAARPTASAAAPSVTDQLDAIRKNQKDSRSLSDAGGSPGGDITVERLANMSPEEFEEFYESMPKGKLDKLMGKSPM